MRLESQINSRVTWPKCDIDQRVTRLKELYDPILKLWNARVTRNKSYMLWDLTIMKQKIKQPSVTWHKCWKTPKPHRIWDTWLKCHMTSESKVTSYTSHYTLSVARSIKPKRHKIWELLGLRSTYLGITWPMSWNIHEPWHFWNVRHVTQKVMRYNCPTT